MLTDYDDVIKWKHFPRCWPFVPRIYRSQVNSPYKGQWRGALMFFICAWTNDWINNCDAGDLRHHRHQYDVTVILIPTGLTSCADTDRYLRLIFLFLQNIYAINTVHVLLFDKNLTLGCLWLLVFVLSILILGIWCSTIPLQYLPGCFCPWTFFENIWFNTVLTDPFMSHLATQLGYSAGEFQALQLIVLAAFGVVD